MQNAIIDLRSDTVTKPTAEMRRVIAEAPVGDDVLGDDPSVIALQEKVAALMGKEAACFVPTGTMANQAAIRAHTEPGDELIAHADSHIIHYETGAPAALSGVMIRPMSGPRGLFDVADLDAGVRPDNAHSPRSRLVIIENTQNRGGGAIWPMDQVIRVSRRARELGLRLHMDGARIWNACAATGIAPAEYARHFDSVSCCFSKGLGCPAGSAVAGDKATIARVHRFAKMFGGKMRQSGILAAAAIYALDHHRDRLKEDHANAKRFADMVNDIPGLALARMQRDIGIETNMVFIDLPQQAKRNAAQLCEAFAGVGVRVLPTGAARIRAVCHLDVTRPMVEDAARRIRGVMGA